MDRPAKFAPFFQRLIDAPDAALAALRRDPHRFATELISEERGRLSADAAIPAFNALGAMLFDVAGARVMLGGPAWLPTTKQFAVLQVESQARRAGSRLFVIQDDGAPAVHALWAPVNETGGWNLPASLRRALNDHPDGRLVLIAGGAIGEGPVAAAVRAYGLTSLEGRVAAAVLRGGSGRAAAELTGLAYATVRGALSTAARRMQVPNLPALVRALVAASFGVLPGEGDPGAILADMLPLTSRQGQIAALVADGQTREAIARGIGGSAAVVKKELESIYGTLGVASAAELARLVVEVRALRLFARSTDGAPGFYDPAVEPTRLTPRGDGTQIAWSDYGPSSGRPVLVVHSNWQARPVPRPLLAALHDAGFRPIAIDRPGFGGTPMPMEARPDAFAQAIDDAVTVLDRLGVDRVPVIARCGAQFVAAFKLARPERLGPVVLVSPTPQTDDGGLRRGIVGVIKEAFYRSPRLIEFFFRIICAQVTLQRTETLTRAIVSGSSTDEALVADPAFIRDRLRAIRPLSTGNMAGAVREEQVISHGGYNFVPIDAYDWTVLQGLQDVHNDFAEVECYWRPILPHAQFQTVPDGGRFMTSSHPALVVETLLAADG